MLQTKGIDFGINVVIAIAIFYVGKMVISLVVRGIRKVMQRQEVDKTLETFVCNLVRMVLLVIVVIAAIGQLGIRQPRSSRSSAPPASLSAWRCRARCPISQPAS